VSVGFNQYVLIKKREIQYFANGDRCLWRLVYPLHPTVAVDVAHEERGQRMHARSEDGVLNIRIPNARTRVSIMFSPQQVLMHRPGNGGDPGAAEPALCLVFQDVESETWPLFRPLLRRLDAFGEVPLSLLVAPERRPGRSLADDLHFAAEMDRRLIRGDELVMRGYGTTPDAPGRKDGDTDADHAMRGDASYPPSLSEHDEQVRLRAGLAQFAELDWPVEGFAASGWQLGDGARAALGKSSFRYTFDGEHLIRLVDNWLLHMPVAVGSDLGAPWDDPGSSTTDPTVAGGHLEQMPCLRLVIHSRDLQHPQGRDFWVHKLDEMLAERRPLTLSGWLERAEARVG
jgi:predicted deacetylase